MTTNKQKFGMAARDAATRFADMSDDLAALNAVYWDRAYNSGGADELTDADVESLGVTAADVTGMITFADALETFLTSNRAYLSKMRNDL